MKKTLCFLYDTMADFEVTLACDLMAGFGDKEVISIAYDKAPKEGMSKLKYVADMTVKEAMDLEDVECLIIPGGMERILKDDFKELIQKLDKEGKLICAICAAPVYLAEAGILENHKYTTTLNEEYFKTNGIKDYFPWNNYVEERVVKDGNIITAKGRAFVDFAAEIIGVFGAYDDEDDKADFLKSYKGE